MADAEAIVVGGGPAGSTLAAELARRGHRVLLLDKARFPRHKACSEYVNPGGVRVLRAIGMEGEVLAAGAHRMEGMRVHAPNGAVYLADFAGSAGETALGLSRWTLDALLLARAEEAGVEICERAHVRDLVREDGRVAGVEATVAGGHETLRAPLVIGADGRNSAVRRALGLEVSLRWPRKTGLVAHYRGVAGLDGHGAMHVGRGLYAGLAPLENGLANVALVSADAAIDERDGSVADYFATMLASFPAVAATLSGAERVGGIRGVGAMAMRARRVAGDGWLLLGDAASFLDPFTGDGIYEALRAAQLAAPVVSASLKAGDTGEAALAPYRAARRRVFTTKRQVCWIVQGFVNAPPLMNYVTPRLAEREPLARTLACVLGNTAPASRALSPVFLARLLRP